MECSLYFIYFLKHLQEIYIFELHTHRNLQVDISDSPKLQKVKMKYKQFKHSAYYQKIQKSLSVQTQRLHSELRKKIVLIVSYVIKMIRGYQDGRKHRTSPLFLLNFFALLIHCNKGNSWSCLIIPCPFPAQNESHL